MNEVQLITLLTLTTFRPPSPLPFHSRGCQIVAQPAYFMVEWHETQTDAVMSSHESFMVE